MVIVALRLTAGVSKFIFRWLSGIQKKNVGCKLLNETPMKRRRQELLYTGVLSDVTLTCDGKDIACHRFVLAENSPVFQAMFTSGMSEANTENNSGAVKIKGVAYNILHKIVTFLYTRDIDISGEGLIEILQFADMYQMDTLREICGDVLLSNITLESAAGVWQTAHKYHVEHILEAVKRYITENFYVEGKGQVALTRGFLELDKDDLLPLLSDPRLAVPSENHVLSVLLSWVAHNKDRTRHVAELLESCVRFAMLHVTATTFCLQRLSDHLHQFDDGTKLVLFEFLQQAPGCPRKTVASPSGD